MYDSDDCGLSVEDMLRETGARDLTYNIFQQGINGMYHNIPMTVRFSDLHSDALCKVAY